MFCKRLPSPQYSPPQPSTVHYIPEQPSTALYRPVQPSKAQYCSVQHSAVHYSPPPPVQVKVYHHVYISTLSRQSFAQKHPGLVLIDGQSAVKISLFVYFQAMFIMQTLQFLQQPSFACLLLAKSCAFAAGASGHSTRNCILQLSDGVIQRRLVPKN